MIAQGMPTLSPIVAAFPKPSLEGGLVGSSRGLAESSTDPSIGVLLVVLLGVVLLVVLTLVVESAEGGFVSAFSVILKWRVTESAVMSGERRAW